MRGSSLRAEQVDVDSAQASEVRDGGENLAKFVAICCVAGAKLYLEKLW